MNNNTKKFIITAAALTIGLSIFLYRKQTKTKTLKNPIENSSPLKEDSDFTQDKPKTTDATNPTTPSPLPQKEESANTSRSIEISPPPPDNEQDYSFVFEINLNQNPETITLNFDEPIQNAIQFTIVGGNNDSELLGFGFNNDLQKLKPISFFENDWQAFETLGKTIQNIKLTAKSKTQGSLKVFVQYQKE